MPRFHLHIRSGTDFIEDEEGIDFPDLSDAIREAFAGARSLMSGEVEEGTLDLNQSIEIHDAHGSLVETVKFTDAVRIVAAGEDSVSEPRRDAGL